MNKQIKKYTLLGITLFKVIWRRLMHTERKKLICNQIQTLEKLKQELAFSNFEKVFIIISIPFNAVLYQRPQHLAVNFAKLNNLVLYVDNNYSAKISKNLYVLDEENILSIAELLKRDIYVIIPHYNEINKLLSLGQNGYKIIFEYLDEISDEIMGERTPIRECYERLEEVNPFLIIASANKLYQEMVVRFGEERVILNPNAVEIEHFKNAEKSIIPDDLKNCTKHGKPIIGYYGAIAPWLDYDLINRAAKERPNYNFVFIGYDYDGKSAKKLKQPNITFLNEKHYGELPQYSIHFDVCIIPFKEGEIAKSTSPLKLFEYMAAKKAVVVTKDMLECYGYEGVFPSENQEEFILNLDKALVVGKDVNIQNKLFGYALENTWERRAVAIIQKLDELEVQMHLPLYQTSSAKFLSSIKTMPPVKITRLNDEEWAQTFATRTNEIVAKIRNNEKLNCWTDELKRLTLHGQNIIEIGCASGGSLLYLAKRGRIATGLDYSPEFCKTLESNAASLGLSVKSICADITKPLPIEDNVFDVVYHTGVIEHFSDDEVQFIIHENARITRVGGLVVCMVPNAASLAYRIGKEYMEKTGCWPYGEENAKYTLKDVFCRAGLQNIREYTIDLDSALFYLGYLPQQSYFKRILREIYHNLPTNDNCGQGYLLVTVGEK